MRIPEQDAAARDEPSRFAFEIPGLCCASEAGIIRSEIERTSLGAASSEEARFDFARRTLSLPLRSGEEALVAQSLPRAGRPARRSYA